MGLHDRNYMNEAPSTGVKKLSLTAWLIFIALGLYILGSLIPVYPLFSLSLSEILKGQVWRLFTAAFLLFPTVHPASQLLVLAINLYFTYSLLSTVEKSIGAKALGRTLLYCLGVCTLTGLIINLMGYKGDWGLFFSLWPAGLMIWARLHFHEQMLIFPFPKPISGQQIAKFYPIILAVIGLVLLKDLGTFLQLASAGTAWFLHTPAKPKVPKPRKLNKNQKGFKLIPKEEKSERDRFIEEKIDPILDKIGKTGLNSLTEQEKKTLEKVKKKSRGTGRLP